MKTLNRKLLLLVTAVAVLVTAAVSFLPNWGNEAQAKQGPRLVGTYAVATAAGSPTEGTTGQLVAASDGSITGGILVLNVPRSVLIPGATGRTAVPATVTSGTYTIGPNGLGNADANISIPGQVLVRSFQLLVSQVDGSTVTEAYLSQNEPTLGGGLGFFIVKRVSD